MTLLDVEILEERVRGVAAKSSIREAVRCYKAGAYRSCVISTWIALVHDFVGKFRDLAIHGDAGAKKLVIEFDRIQADRDTSAALKFEREVLDISLKDFELVSPQEYTELRRLFEDRNRFGHPNLNQDSEILDATPELARTHLRSAVEYVLERPPVQGKEALAQIQAATESAYFPRNLDDAEVVLSTTPLVRAKKNVVREFYMGCVASLIREKPAIDVFERRVSAAAACRKIHPEIVDALIDERMQVIFDKTEDSDLPYLMVLCVRSPELAKKISHGLKIRLAAYVKKMPDESLAAINFASEYDFLKREVAERLSTVTSAQLRDFTQKAVRNPSRFVVERAVELLVKSKSFDSSNAVLTAISERMVGLLHPVDVKQLVDAAANGEVSGSFNYAPLLKKLADSGVVTEGDLKRASELGQTKALSDLVAAD